MGPDPTSDEGVGLDPAEGRPDPTILDLLPEMMNFYIMRPDGGLGGDHGGGDGQ